MVTFDPSDPRKAPLRLAAPSVGIETPSLSTVNNTLSTTVVEPDTATVVTSDRFNELQVETATVSARSRSARIAQSHSNLTTVGMSDGNRHRQGSQPKRWLSNLFRFSQTRRPRPPTRLRSPRLPHRSQRRRHLLPRRPLRHSLASQLFSRVIVIRFGRRITGRRPPGFRDQLACLLRILFPH